MGGVDVLRARHLCKEGVESERGVVVFPVMIQLSQELNKGRVSG